LHKEIRWESDWITQRERQNARNRHNHKNRKVRRNFELESLDMATGKLLWSRNFSKQRALGFRIGFQWLVH